MTTEIFTIGHSNHTWESFAPLLADNSIELLVDTRTRPVSRFAPFANHRTLPDLLGRRGHRLRIHGRPVGRQAPQPRHVRFQPASPTTTRCAPSTTSRKPSPNSPAWPPAARPPSYYASICNSIKRRATLVISAKDIKYSYIVAISLKYSLYTWYFLYF